jgi:hypothetical protein
MTTRKFKDRTMQAMYENCLRLGADTSSEFYFTDRDGSRSPRTGAGHRFAYWNGRNGKPASWARNTPAYACWAAGRDAFRATPNT